MLIITATTIIITTIKIIKMHKIQMYMLKITTIQFLLLNNNSNYFKIIKRKRDLPQLTNIFQLLIKTLPQICNNSFIKELRLNSILQISQKLIQLIILEIELQ